MTIPILSGDAERILAFIKKHPGIKMRHIALELDSHYDGIVAALEMLERKAFILARYPDFYIQTEGETHYPYRLVTFYPKQ